MEVRRPKTNVIPLCHATKSIQNFPRICRQKERKANQLTYQSHNLASRNRMSQAEKQCRLGRTVYATVNALILQTNNAAISAVGE